ncbi:recombinase family protein [Haematospirillum jordaniae]|uniref:recombinase family protein n=1 Tax=Haematospirillum jordaniae TaxID=1549855 RepID=UPI0014332E33|nr:recombinase family protein [Haematospirillum jordaniae]NKD82343.1 recombinase family protein [Haematospirillum jordaniae]NKD84486.1 recombinase family protein [Haematospirillum jordaniae]
MKRAAIYARFSSDRQNEKSCKDQITLCSAWAERNNCTVVDTFQDQAISGSSTINRFGLASLMRAAREKRFNVVIAESLDRLSRDQADLGQLRKELTFLGIGIFTVQDGEVGAIHIGVKGLMGELYLADLAQKTRRGLRAVVTDGRHAGGRSFGYNLVNGKSGELEINEREARIVCRIFADYIAGCTPRQIAASLNREGIAGPRGGKWNASTINGSRSRQNGILQNRLYIGHVVWNRQRFVKNPATGTRVSRPNPESEWLTADAPHLRIIDDATFAEASAMKQAKGHQHSSHARKPHHLLSGLVKCGVCGASYTVMGNDRLGCAGFRERGDCSNNRTVTRQHIEERVLSALQTQLTDPDLIGEYVRAYHAERKRLQQTARSGAEAKQKRLKELTTGIERIVDHVVAGTASAALIDRLTMMESEKATLEAELEALGTDADKPIDLHPGAAEKYRRIAADLHNHLRVLESDPDRDALFADIRRLIEKVVVTPTGERKPVNLEVHGLLASLLSASVGGIEFRGMVVAGAGFEPATFRL